MDSRHRTEPGGGSRARHRGLTGAKDERDFHASCARAHSELLPARNAAARKRATLQRVAFEHRAASCVPSPLLLARRTAARRHLRARSLRRSRLLIPSGGRNPCAATREPKEGGTWSAACPRQGLPPGQPLPCPSAGKRTHGTPRNTTDVRRLTFSDRTGRAPRILPRKTAVSRGDRGQAGFPAPLRQHPCQTCRSLLSLIACGKR